MAGTLRPFASFGSNRHRPTSNALPPITVPNRPASTVTAAIYRACVYHRAVMTFAVGAVLRDTPGAVVPGASPGTRNGFLPEVLNHTFLVDGQQIPVTGLAWLTLFNRDAAKSTQIRKASDQKHLNRDSLRIVSTL